MAKVIRFLSKAVIRKSLPLNVNTAPTGIVFRLTNVALVNLYSSGTFNCLFSAPFFILLKLMDIYSYNGEIYCDFTRLTQSKLAAFLTKVCCNSDLSRLLDGNFAPTPLAPALTPASKTTV